eukprot:Seg963.4 transcript_id=Seg963.4/GoldUCD/mRNA.D3Y31 product="hypothetical protein" protein_id=Seg963.4/GoldUCD/D3Y31
MADNVQTSGLEQLVSSILSHPNFQQSLDAAFTHRDRESEGNTSATTGGTHAASTTSNRPTTTATTSRPSTSSINGSQQPSSPSLPSFTTANEELASIFGRGGAQSQNRNPPRFYRGSNSRRPAP